MRELLNSDRAAFPLAAARIFHDFPDERGCRYLITILWTQNLLIPLLASAAIPNPLAVAMAHAAIRVDSQFHFRVSNYLNRGFENDGAPMEEASRLLDILSSTMDAAALVPFLQKILVHPNPRVRSKATLLIGRVHSAIAALEKLLADKDPRVRANAIEALWCNSDPRVEPLFVNALTDASNRVAANAVVGLYLGGSTRAIPAALAMIKHSSVSFQISGAWAMGKTGDPRFLPYLGKLLGDSTGLLRKAVFRSLQASQRCAIARTHPAPLVHLLGFYRYSGCAHLHVSVSDPVDRQPVALPPTAFFLSAGSEPVVEFSCSPHLGARTHVSFVLPGCPSAEPVLRLAQQVLTELLARKPEAEQWAVRHYGDGPARSGSEAAFTKDPGLLTAQISPAGTSPKIAGTLSDVLQEQIEVARQSAERHHVVTVLDERWASAEGPAQKLLMEAPVGNLAFHFLGSGPIHGVQELCEKCGASYLAAESTEALGRDLESLYDSLMCCYALAFDGSILDAHLAEPFTIQVHNSVSVGKLQIPRERFASG